MRKKERIEVKISLEKTQENYNFKTLYVRNLFNMVFVGQDGLTIHIYTAIVFAMLDVEKIAEIPPEPKGIANPAAKLSVSFHGEQDGSFRTTSISDLTVYFIRQGKRLSQIWGDRENGVKKGEENGKQFLSIQEGNTYFQAFPAAFDSDTEKRLYHISPDSSGNSVSWVKSELVLSNSFKDKKLQFRVLFDVDDGVTVACPDYMLYFSIPPELKYNSTECTVSFGDDKTPKFHHIVPLAKDTVLKLQEWISDEDIRECERCRLVFDGQKALELGKKKDITVTIPISESRDVHGNKQFFVGLLVAFLASFSADYTRIFELNRRCFDYPDTLSSHYYGIFFFASIILAYIAIVTPLSRVFNQIKSDPKIAVICILKIFGVFFSLSGPCLFHLVYPICKFLFLINLSPILHTIVFYYSLSGIVLLIIYVFFSAWKRDVFFYNYL